MAVQSSNIVDFDAFWYELGEVENECISHNFVLLAIFVPQIVKVSGKLRILPL